MTQIDNWHDVVVNVENANLQKQTIERRIKGLNKRAYKQQLDREVDIKNYENFVNNALKIKQLEQAKSLAQAQKMAKIQQRKMKQKLQQKYGEQNQNLIKFQTNLRTYIKNTQSNGLPKQHPFVKLVDQQDSRVKQLRRKFIKQNEINHLQEEMKNQQKLLTKEQQKMEKDNFINHVDQVYEKRTQQRQRFKNKYLKLKRGQINKEDQSQIVSDSVEKMYISYLNQQMRADKERKMRQKSQVIEDKRLSQFYSHNLEPDSSPAFLGRNPLSHDRRRQLYYINKHLNTVHERQFTSNSEIRQKPQTEFSLSPQRIPNRSDKYVRMARQLNPQISNDYRIKYNPLNAHLYKNQTQHLNSKSYQNGNNFQDLKKPIDRNHSYRDNEMPKFDSNAKEVNSEQSRRIKSELAEHISERKLPQIQRRFFDSNESKKNISIELPRVNQQKSRSPPKQYLRYDPITGKHVAFYV